MYALKNAVMVKTYHSALINLTFEGSSVQIPEVMPGFLVRFCPGLVTIKILVALVTVNVKLYA